MSYYEDERPRRHKSTRERRSRDDYDTDQYQRGSNGGGRESSLVKKSRSDSFSSVEEVQRDFPPAGGYGRKSAPRDGRRARSAGGRDRDRYGDDSYDQYSGHQDDYASSRRSHGRSDDKRRTGRRDSYSDSSAAHSPPKRRQSISEKALGALGIGGLAAAATGHGKDRGSHRRGRSSSSSGSSRSRSHRGGGGRKPTSKEDIAQVVKAALTAGAAEAIRSRHQPGGWGGEKGKRVLTAAISAGGVDKLVDRKGDKHDTRNLIGSTLAGLATTHLVNGSRSRSRSRGRNRRGGGGGRARSESRSGLKQLASAGLITAAGKTIYNKVRSKSRGGRRGSDSSADSYDSRNPRHRRDKKQKRSNSIAAYATKGLAALGLGEAADKVDSHDRRRSGNYDDDDDHRRRSGRSGAPPSYQQGGNGYGGSRDVGQPRPDEYGALVHPHPNGFELAPRHTGDADTDSDSDLGDSSEDERARKKARYSSLASAGLATVASIHAAHSVYQSMEERDSRKEALTNGDITAEKARRERNKAKLQDAVSIGIAALGIKSAVGEWKETKEKREQAVEIKEKVQRHKEKRQARERKMQSMGMQQRYSGSAPTLSSMPTDRGRPYDGPMYSNSNPYGSPQAGSHSELYDSSYSPSAMTHPYPPPPPSHHPAQQFPGPPPGQPGPPPARYGP